MKIIATILLLVMFGCATEPEIPRVKTGEVIEAPEGFTELCKREKQVECRK